MDLVRISRELCRAVSELEFGPPVTHVYNPLEYARAPHESYLRRYGEARREVLLIGMNPGPFGMAQTGVPFGEVGMAGGWLGVRGRVARPPGEHPKRPILGFECARSEVSGSRLWGWARDRFGTPERFFDRFYVTNYSPLVFMEESGRNRTPDKLPKIEREPLYRACDTALRRTVEAVVAGDHVTGDRCVQIADALRRLDLTAGTACRERLPYCGQRDVDDVAERILGEFSDAEDHRAGVRAAHPLVFRGVAQLIGIHPAS